jgi:hypothetical protein
MSTQEPGGGQPEGGTPGLAQPQDPWADGVDYGHGQASVPTDPHGPQYDPYATFGQEYATPHSDPWGGQTVNQPAGGWPQQQGAVPAAPPPPPQRGKTVPVLIALLVVVVLGAAAGAIYWFSQGRNTAGGTGVTPSPGVSTPVTTGPETFQAHTVTEGTCLVNDGLDTKPKMRKAECAKGAFKVLRIAKGADLPKNQQGKFDKYIAAQVCSGVNGYQNYYAFDAEDNTKDLIFCMTVLD